MCCYLYAVREAWWDLSPLIFRAPGCRYKETLNDYRVFCCCVASGEVTDAEDD